MPIASLTTTDGDTSLPVGKVCAGFLDAQLPSRKRLGLLLGALVLLTTIPRFLLAWQSSVICDDGYYYLSVAHMWEQGQTEAALNYLNLNIYPLILWGLNGAGLAFPWNFKFWGVCVSCLTVFPLFGLARRLFNDRTAAIAVVLFAIHPELIELSVEPIREATFWFFFLTAAYLLHRCATSLRHLAMPMAAGTAMACAVHTRSEGWTLILLALVWPLSLAPAAVTRLRQTQRIATVATMIPLFLLLLNVTVLAGHRHWEWGRFDRLPKFVAWMQHQASPSNRNVKSSPTFVAKVRGRRAPKPSLRAVEPAHNTLNHDGFRRAPWFMYVHHFCESFEYFNVVLLVIGATQCRRRFSMPLHAPLITMAGVILLAVGMLLVQHGNINGRYFLTALVITLPIQALGVTYLLQCIYAITALLAIGQQPRIAAIALVAVAVIVLFWNEALTGRHESRVAQAKLGSRLRSQYGPFQLVETDWRSGRVGYYAVGKLPHIIYNSFQKPIHDPDLIIAARPVPASFRNRAHDYGLREVSITDARHHEFSAFVRSAQSHEQAAGPPPTSDQSPTSVPREHRNDSGPPVASLPEGLY